MDLLTQRQHARLAKLPEDHGVVGARDDSPVVRRLDGQLARVRPNRHMPITSLVERVQSYLRLERC